MHMYTGTQDFFGKTSTWTQLVLKLLVARSGFGTQVLDLADKGLDG